MSLRCQIILYVEVFSQENSIGGGVRMSYVWMEIYWEVDLMITRGHKGLIKFGKILTLIVGYIFLLIVYWNLLKKQLDTNTLLMIWKNKNSNIGHRSMMIF